jgi:hypothetical protein
MEGYFLQQPPTPAIPPEFERLSKLLDDIQILGEKYFDKMFGFDLINYLVKIQ